MIDVRFLSVRQTVMSFETKMKPKNSIDCLGVNTDLSRLIEKPRLSIKRKVVEIALSRESLDSSIPKKSSRY